MDVSRDTLMTNQPDIITPPETNWPDPLVDPSGKLRIVVTNGSSGSQTNKDLVSTSQQDNKEHHLSEGNSPIDTGNMLDQGGYGNKFQTSQQNVGDHSTTESGD